MKSNTFSRFAAKVAIFGVVVLAATSMALACSSGDDDNAGTTATVAASTTAGSQAGNGAGNTPTASTGTNGSTGADADVEAFIRGFIDSYNNGDANAFFGKMTDEAAAQFLNFQGMDTAELDAAKQQAAPFIGETQLDVQKIEVTDVSGGSASADLTLGNSGVLEGDKIALTKNGDSWTVSTLELFAASPDVPAGYTTYDMTLDEFKFGLDGEPTAGKAAFALKNVGQQLHEAVLIRLDSTIDLQQALQSPQQPEGVTVIGGATNIAPGDTYNLIFTDPLTPGRYAFIDFLPDTTEGANGTPHAFEGMTAEFTVK